MLDPFSRLCRQILSRLRAILRAINIANRKKTYMSAQLDALTASIAALGDAVTKATTKLEALAQDVTDALQGDEVAALATQVQAAADALNASVAAVSEPEPAADPAPAEDAPADPVTDQTTV